MAGDPHKTAFPPTPRPFPVRPLTTDGWEPDNPNRKEAVPL